MCITRPNNRLKVKNVFQPKLRRFVTFFFLTKVVVRISKRASVFTVKHNKVLWHCGAVSSIILYYIYKTKNYLFKMSNSITWGFSFCFYKQFFPIPFKMRDRLGFVLLSIYNNIYVRISNSGIKKSKFIYKYKKKRNQTRSYRLQNILLFFFICIYFHQPKTIAVKNWQRQYNKKKNAKIKLTIIENVRHDKNITINNKKI